MALSQYADLGPLPTNRPNPPKIETKTQCPYVDVLPHATTPDNGNGDKKNADKATPKGPPTVESVMSLLWGVAGRWKEIAEGLEFDEDLIDEIDTNNDTDEGCLQVCVGMWVTKLQPSWEKLSHVLKELGEVELARQVGSEESQPQVKSFQCTSKGDSEVVTGTHGNTPPLTDSNIDGNRGVEKLMADEEPKPVVHQSSALSGDEKVYYCYTSVEEGIIPSQELTTTFFHKPKSRYILKVDGACVVVVNINARPGVTEGSVNMQQTDHFRQRSVARSEPTSKPTEPQLDSSHPGCGGSYEVVNGVERAILPFDDNDGENRGAKSTMPNGSSTLPYLNNFTVQGGKEYDKALAESPLTTKGKRHHTFDTPMLAHGAGSICFAEENICVLPVNNEGEEDSHPDPTGSWRQESADNSCTVQGDARDMVPEGDEIIPFANIPPTLPHKDAGKCVCPPLGFEAKEGELVVGGLNEKSSLLDPSSVEPSPVAVQPQPEDSTSLQSEIQLQESGRSSELVPRHQGRENDMTKPMKWQDHNQGVLVRGLQRLGVPLSCILLMTGTKSCCKVHIPDASYK
ncbi:hypothetical protein GBAR_LOCUS15989 [Geodia barretti]|uniref:Death domain-containing protein n=1 Tax=Geodia barretti TaxID=519541 RepID=A0AA35SDF7_GEOBA|nr:hypothetical protein GBAR_LOCUS15989 [Geodia barretti]